MKHKKALKKKALKFGVAIGLAVAILGFSYFAFITYFKDKIYPYVAVNGVAMGGLTQDQAKSKLDKLYPDDIKLELASDENIMSASLAEAGISVEKTKAIENAFKSGHGNIWQRDIGLEVVIDSKKLQEYIATNFPTLKTDPVDAKYELVKNQPVVIPGKPGRGVNLAPLRIAIKKSVLERNLSEPIFLATVEVPESLNDKILTALLPDAVRFLSVAPQLLVENTKFNLTLADRFSLMAVEVIDGTPKIRASEEKVKVYLEKLGTKTAVAAAPDVYYDTGELSETGHDGRKLDVESSVVPLTEALNSNSNEPIVLASKTIPKDKKTIDRPFTPGQFPGRYIEIDLSSQQLFQMEGETLVATRKVSTGKWTTPTPIGTFWINGKHPRAFSKTYQLYMPYWMSFIGGQYGIHELPEWPDGRKEGASHIGRAVSHGCIRLGVGAAAEVYNWADLNTPVVIHK